MRGGKGQDGEWAQPEERVFDYVQKEVWAVDEEEENGPVLLSCGDGSRALLAVLVVCLCSVSIVSSCLSVV